MIQPQPQRYRVRLYDEGAEVLTNRRWMVVLDLTPGPALRYAEAVLDAQLQALAYIHGARGDAVRRYTLRIDDWDTHEALFHWPARTWPDPR